jgi:hypothetical protein
VCASEHVAVAFGEDHDAARARDVLPQHVGIDAVAVEEIGFGGPADTAGVAAIGRGDEFDQCLHIGRDCFAEVQFVFAVHASARAR